MSPLVYDPFDPQIHVDPLATYRWLRREAPVYHNSQLGFFALSRFEDVLNAFRDSATFSSREGASLEPVSKLPSLLHTDPPQHTRLRRVMSGHFTRQRVAALEPRIRAFARRLLEPLAGAGCCDLVRDFAATLPSQVITLLLGIPEADREQHRIWTETVLRRDDRDGHVPQSARHAMENQLAYFRALIRERRRSPRADLLSVLCSAEVEGRPLGEDDILGYCIVLIAGGNETTEKLIANTVWMLSRHPDQRKQLVQDPTRVPQAIEESLRYRSPTQYMVRTVTREIELHDTRIPAGEKVILLIGAANHDERIFDRPERFDIDRRIRRHLAFGFGAHFCLGAALARLESRIALEEIHRTLPSYQVDEDGISFVPGGNVSGLASLPLHYAS